LPFPDVLNRCSVWQGGHCKARVHYPNALGFVAKDVVSGFGRNPFGFGDALRAGNLDALTEDEIVYRCHVVFPRTPTVEIMAFTTLESKSDFGTPSYWKIYLFYY
jgi:hypothetical protein